MSIPLVIGNWIIAGNRLKMLKKTSGYVSKGVEFREVAAMACDNEVIPLQFSIESIADDVDLEEVYNTERHLLYVACTRAREYLLITSVNPASEFLDDFKLQFDNKRQWIVITK